MSRELELKLITRVICLAILMPISSIMQGAITQFSQNDPYPVYTTLDPHEFLYTYDKDRLLDLPSIKEKPEWFNVSISPFGQNATCGRGPFYQSCANLINQFNNPDTFFGSRAIELGDLGGRWGMIALLFGQVPCGQVLPPALVEARNVLFPTVPPGTPIDDNAAIDQMHRFGYFSVPIEYKKRGIRFEFEAMLLCDVGVQVCIGVADICQTPTFNDLTCLATVGCSQTPVGTGSFDPNNPNLTVNNVETTLMDNLFNIAPQICRDLDRFQRVSCEDLRVGAFWRHAYLINKGRTEHCFEEFLLIPFFELEGSIPLGRERQYNWPFSVAFGSNDFNGLGFSTGLDIDFRETIEIGAEAGVTHFFARDICNMPVPTNRYQSGIYPFLTDVRYQPGLNVHFCAKMLAYHFYDCLSFYFQYVLVRHETDRICLRKPDCAFLPEELERRSCWTSQMANMSFYYDISPCISLGFLWQAPVGQRNAYKSSTVLFSFNATY